MTDPKFKDVLDLSGREERVRKTASKPEPSPDGERFTKGADMDLKDRALRDRILEFIGISEGAESDFSGLYIRTDPGDGTEQLRRVLGSMEEAGEIRRVVRVMSPSDPGIGLYDYDRVEDIPEEMDDEWAEEEEVFRAREATGFHKDIWKRGPALGEWEPEPVPEGLHRRFREVLRTLTGSVPPEWARYRQEEELALKLQDWCASNVPLEWMTGLSVIEAAELIVDGAVENGNLTREGEYSE